MISPNLEALLEHDERVRRAKSSSGGSWSTSSSTRSWGSVVEQPGVQSLPVPPRRGPRRTTPISPKTENEEALRSPRDSSGSGDISIPTTPATPRSTPSTPNPYVNPSPTFEDISPPKEEKLARVPPRSSSIQRPEEAQPSVPGSPVDSLGRFLGRNKRAATASSKTSLQERAQQRGKLLKLRDTSSSSMRSSHSRSRSTSTGSADHISISSTVRFPSSSGHDSFIDLTSPIQPQMKPPLPTSPKPDFEILALRSNPQDKSNQLDAGARADLVRKTRKLAQVFGKTPEAKALSSQPESTRSSAVVPEWPPTGGTQYLTANGRRRHSSPLTPDQFSFLSHLTSESDPEQSPVTERSKPRSESPTSFIDLSDNDDSISAIIKTNKPSRPMRQSLLSAQSLLEKMTPEERAEEERRRKREKLAKLHRFLGSRVPTRLALGLDDTSSLSLPPQKSFQGQNEVDDTKRKIWLRRRRSSSAAVFPSAWDDDLERLKEDLNVQEKAINVRRALKMEKLFGVAPPQKLYHTRHAPSASLSVPSLTVRSMPTPPPESRTVSQSTYKYKYRKAGRPSTSESSKQLIPKDRRSSDDYTDHHPHRTSLVYTHYQHSLNSLTDIIDRDDKDSLRELHLYLNEAEPSPVDEQTPTEDHMPERPPSERRHSLPARPSMTSLSSEFDNISSPKPEVVTDFQLRRRRAAKLTQFFGVDYRDLIQDVLDSIENGLEHERRRGTLRPEEADDLLRKLRSLKTKRDGTF